MENEKRQYDKKMDNYEARKKLLRVKIAGVTAEINLLSSRLAAKSNTEPMDRSEQLPAIGPVGVSIRYLKACRRLRFQRNPTDF